MAEETLFYEKLNGRMAWLLRKERNWLATMSNASALLFQNLERINWAGFYLFDGNELVLAPFQGKPACTRIGPGKGVCGTSFAERKTLVVPDVNKFPGHIACDSASRSEIVVPLIRNGSVLGVLDIDSPEPERFGPDDAEGLETFVSILMEGIDWKETNPYFTGMRSE